MIVIGNWLIFILQHSSNEISIHSCNQLFSTATNVFKLPILSIDNAEVKKKLKLVGYGKNERRSICLFFVVTCWPKSFCFACILLPNVLPTHVLYIFQWFSDTRGQQ